MNIKAGIKIKLQLVVLQLSKIVTFVSCMLVDTILPRWQFSQSNAKQIRTVHASCAKELYEPFNSSFTATTIDSISTPCC